MRVKVGIHCADERDMNGVAACGVEWVGCGMGVVMNAQSDRAWVGQFRLVQYFRQAACDVERHRSGMRGHCGRSADRESAIVDWTVHKAEGYFRNHPVGEERSGD